MKMIDVDKTSPDIQHAIEKGHSHYGIEDDETAILQLLIRSVKHAEMDSKRHSAEIDQLKQQVDALETIVKRLMN